NACQGKLLGSLFFEASTRTRFSFHAAMLRLGGGIFGFSNPKDSSISKGESLADTMRMVSTYSDVIVMRTSQEGAAKAASMYSEVPIINAGDGGHLHPTQTLTDLATISMLRGKIGGFTIGMCGDLKYGRTVHSLVTALSKFKDIKFCMIAPPGLEIPEYLLKFMRGHGLQYTECSNLEEAMSSLDILYMTRIQRERFYDTYDEEHIYTDLSDFILTADKLRSASDDLIVLHPLPRVDEIERAVDADPRAKYFEQAKYGMYIRMSLLLKFTLLPRAVVTPQVEGGHACQNPVCVSQTERYLPKLVTDTGACGYSDKPL
ncbi:MAG: aspartate carbamoyltransferase, partial [Clostridiales bacterium]|nr:aspartate carbamoyltransferase [Clostridiales bacterium]